VITTSLFFGISSVMFFRLFSDALNTDIFFVKTFFFCKDGEMFVFGGTGLGKQAL